MNDARVRSQVCLKTATACFVALALLASAGAAHATDDDPFAESSPAAAPEAVPSKSRVPAAPGSAPPEAAANLSPGIIEQLPASAYPEPFTRGLYGGPLWLDMQGLQWPYLPRTSIGISGYAWIDANYRLIRSGNTNVPPTTHELLDQGRFLLRVTPTYVDGTWFVQVQAEMVANTNQYNYQGTNGAPDGVVAADDVWLRTGTLQSWDVTVGRFQAFDVYPLGMGLDLNTYERLGAYDPVSSSGPNGPTAVAPLYAADFMLYRPNFPHVGNAALHLYPIRPLRIEVLGQFGNDGRLDYIGGRPAAIFDLGFLKLRGALEYQYAWNIDAQPMYYERHKNRGGAASAQVVFAPFIEAGVNFGYASIDVSDSTSHGPNLGSSGNRLSFGGFIDLVPPGIPNLMLGGGADYATFHDLNADKDGNYERSTNLQAYGAAQYLFYKQLYLKLVAGYAKSHFENKASMPPYNDDMFSVRVRMQYLF